MTHVVQGREIELPVVVRDASQWSAQFVVPAGPAQELIGASGLQVAQPVPGRAVMALAVVDYRDSDLDSYHEVAVSFVVRPHDAPPSASAWELVREFFSGQVGVYIHQLPVDQTFTLEAGTGIWGFPKFLAEISLSQRDGRAVCGLRCDGKDVLRLAVQEGGRVTLPLQSPPSYSFRDGILRRTEWAMSGDGRAGRPGGAFIELGDHAISDELRSLGLPKRALMTQSVARMSAVFQDAEKV